MEGSCSTLLQALVLALVSVNRAMIRGALLQLVNSSTIIILTDSLMVEYTVKDRNCRRLLVTLLGKCLVTHAASIVSRA